MPPVTFLTNRDKTINPRDQAAVVGGQKTKHTNFLLLKEFLRTKK